MKLAAPGYDKFSANGVVSIRKNLAQFRGSGNLTQQFQIMSAAQLSVIIPCFNEEKMIGDCMASVRFADEIIVVDSFSTDRTLEIARPLAAKILQHEYVNPAAQKNWAIPQAKHEWVLILDADERATPELEAEIKRILQNPKHDGY
ncbi:MAG: glycosyltransferase family 2 protein, partial [Limisphaerales bacterium]